MFIDLRSIGTRSSPLLFNLCMLSFVKSGQLTQFLQKEMHFEDEALANKERKATAQDTPDYVILSNGETTQNIKQRSDGERLTTGTKCSKCKATAPVELRERSKRLRAKTRQTIVA